MPTVSWREEIAYRIAIWVMWLTCFFGFGLRIRHRERVPRRGPVLIVSNHVSNIDPPLVGLCSTRILKYLARTTLFKNKAFAAFIRLMGAVPIDREVGTEGLKLTLQLLGEGRAVLMFPEGTRTEDGALQELKPGITVLLKKANCTIVPCGLVGVYDAWPRGQKLPKPSPVFLPATRRSFAVAFGEPVPSSHYKTMSRDAILADLTARLQAAIAEAKRYQRT
jgi:1-acyl-sn-glycerol-3-phosphate acyltransferase